MDEFPLRCPLRTVRRSGQHPIQRTRLPRPISPFSIADTLSTVGAEAIEPRSTFATRNTAHGA